MILGITEWSTFLIFTRRSDVRWMCLDCEDDVDVVFPFRSISSAAALDFDSETDTIFWSDITNDTISRANINGSEQKVLSLKLHFVSLKTSLIVKITNYLIF